MKQRAYPSSSTPLHHSHNHPVRHKENNEEEIKDTLVSIIKDRGSHHYQQAFTNEFSKSYYVDSHMMHR